MYNTTDNLGGIAKLFIARAAKAKPYFKIKTNTMILTADQLQQNFEEIHFKVGKAYPRREPVKNAHGTFLNTSLTLELFKHNDYLQGQVSRYQGYQVVLLAMDHDRKWYMLGLPEWPLTWQSGFDFGANPADGQTHLIQLTGLQPADEPKVEIL